MLPGRVACAPPARASLWSPGGFTTLEPQRDLHPDDGGHKPVPCRALTRPGGSPTPRRDPRDPSVSRGRGRPPSSRRGTAGSLPRALAASPRPCPPEAPHVAVLVGEVAARLAAAVLEVGEAAAVEEGGPFAAPGALEGLHEAVVEAVVAGAHPTGLAHRGRLRAGGSRSPPICLGCTRPTRPGPQTPPAGLTSCDPELTAWAVSRRAPLLLARLPLSTWCLVASLALLPPATERLS